MKILLIGSQGKMGKLFCQKIYKENIDQLVAGVDIQNNEQICQNQQNPISPYFSHKEHKTIWSVDKDCEMIVDFSTTEDKEDFIDYALLHKVPLAIFSTNSSGKTKKRLKHAAKHIPVLLCPNTSIGIIAMTKALLNLSKDLSDSDIALYERHHKNKIDNPSGTARILIQAIKKYCSQELNINSLRVGDECGYHEVTFFMQGEKVSISHTANSKEIFINGAIKMIQKLKTKQKGFFTKL